MFKQKGRRTITCENCNKTTTATIRKGVRKKKGADYLVNLFNSPEQDLIDGVIESFAWIVSKKTWRCKNCNSTNIKFK